MFDGNVVVVGDDVIRVVYFTVLVINVDKTNFKRVIW